MAEEVLTVFTTWPDLETARTAARTLVEERLAACGNIVPGVESVYRWEGKVETGAEVLVVFKTVIGSYQQFEARLRALHPYRCRRCWRCASPMGCLRISAGWSRAADSAAPTAARSRPCGVR